MKLQILCAALLAASCAFAQTNPGNPPAPPKVPPSTGSSADTAGSGTTAPRSADSDSSSVAARRTPAFTSPAWMRSATSGIL